jgi:hypothetical protein
MLRQGVLLRLIVSYTPKNTIASIKRRKKEDAGGERVSVCVREK